MDLGNRENLGVENVPPARPGTDEPHGAPGTSVAPNTHQLTHNGQTLSGDRGNPDWTPDQSPG